MVVAAHCLAELPGRARIAVLVLRPGAHAGEHLVGQVALELEFLANIRVHRGRQGAQGRVVGGVESRRVAGLVAVAAGDPAVESAQDQPLVGEEFLAEGRGIDAEFVVEDERVGKPRQPRELRRDLRPPRLRERRPRIEGRHILASREVAGLGQGLRPIGLEVGGQPAVVMGNRREAWQKQGIGQVVRGPGDDRAVVDEP